MPRKKTDVVARFWGKVKKGSQDECWEWQGHISPKGYGYFSLSHDKIITAHRLAYQLTFGLPPDGLCLDHLCRNRKCVNPAHLEVVTLKENVLRGEGISAMNSKKTHCPNGHEFSGDNLFVGRKGDRRCRICEREKCAKRRSALREKRIKAGDLKYAIKGLRASLFGKPNKPIIQFARMIMENFDRSLLPDWIEIISNGNEDKFLSVVQVAKEDIAAEGLQNDISITA